MHFENLVAPVSLSIALAGRLWLSSKTRRLATSHFSLTSQEESGNAEEKSRTHVIAVFIDVVGVNDETVGNVCNG